MLRIPNEASFCAHDRPTGVKIEMHKKMPWPQTGAAYIIAI